MKFEPYPPYTMEQAVIEAKRRVDDKRFVAVTLKSGKLIGNLYFSQGDFDTFEFGYVFHSDFWGQGYAFESAKAFISYAFEQWEVRRIIAMCNPLNVNSWKLLERLSFRREGNLIKNVYFFQDEQGKPIWQDTYEYALLKEEWKDDK